MLYKFADDTSVVGLIAKEDESNYCRVTAETVRWCEENNLILNISKTKEMIIDFRRKISTLLSPLCIDEEVVERVTSFKLLGMTILDSQFP